MTGNRSANSNLSDNEKSRLDDAARAGWLYFIAGRTQDEIARRLKVSRATAQRLVSLCLAEKLITFRLEHPIAACMELAARLTDRFRLRTCDVVPTDPTSPVAVAGIAERAANLLETTLRSEKPAIIAIGTGRAMRAAVEQVRPMDCPDHRLVSLVGNISPRFGDLFRHGRAARRPHHGPSLPDAAAAAGCRRRRNASKC